jgi:hypothetical protein
MGQLTGPATAINCSGVSHPVVAQNLLCSQFHVAARSSRERQIGLPWEFLSFCRACQALQNEPLAPLMKISISPQFGQQQREVSPGSCFGASVLTVGLTGVVMPARSGARLAGFRSYTVCLAYHRRPRACLRRGCLVLAHNSTPDAVWRPGQEKRAEVAHRRRRAGVQRSRADIQHMDCQRAASAARWQSTSSKD